MDMAAKIKNVLSRLKADGRFRISMPFFSYELKLDELFGPSSADDRIKKLDDMKYDLARAIEAINGLKQDAVDKRNELEELNKSLESTRADKETTESVLKLNEESFARILNRASSKGRRRGVIEGVLIGLVTGIISSFFVYYFTKP